MEQLEFDCRLESERELEENVNIALEFACKQVKETSKSKVSNRHDGYGIASEFYAGMKLDQKKVDESMKTSCASFQQRMMPRQSRQPAA